jgi:ATP-dependent protease ClpP protease subunit
MNLKEFGHYFSEGRVIPFWGDFSHENIQRFRDLFLHTIKQHEEGVLVIHLQSGGGNITRAYMASTLVASVASSRPIHIVVDGFADSAATLFLCSVEIQYRHGLEGSTYTLHPPTSTFEEKFSEISMKELTRRVQAVADMHEDILQAREDMVDFYVKETKLKRKEAALYVYDQTKTFTAQEAVIIGLLSDIMKR